MKVMVAYGPGAPVEVEFSELTIIAHQGEYDANVVSAPVVMIASPGTLEEAGPNFDPHWAFPAFWALFKPVPNLPEIDEIKCSGTGFRHLAGLVNLTCKALFSPEHALVHFRYPESHLHPRVQCELGTFFVAIRHPWQVVLEYLGNGGRLRKPIPIRYVKT